MSAKVLKYNGYQGSVEHNLDAERLEGRVLHIKSLITYAGSTVAELKASFQQEVDEYVSDCEELGVEPEKPYSGTFQVRLEPSVHRKLAFNAAEAGIGFNKYITDTLRKVAAPESAETSSFSTLVMERVSRQLEDTYSALTTLHSVSHIQGVDSGFGGIMHKPRNLAVKGEPVLAFANRRNVNDQAFEFSS